MSLQDNDFDKNSFDLGCLLKDFWLNFYPGEINFENSSGKAGLLYHIAARSVQDNDFKKNGFNLGYLLKGFWLNFIPKWVVVARAPTLKYPKKIWSQHIASKVSSIQ